MNKMWNRHHLYATKASNMASSVTRIEKFFAVFVIAFLLSTADAGTGGTVKGDRKREKSEKNGNSSSRKKERSRKRKGKYYTHAPSPAPSAIHGDFQGISSLATETLAPSEWSHIFPSPQPSQTPSHDGLDDELVRPRESVAISLPRMEMDVSTATSEREINVMEYHEIFHTFLTEHFSSSLSGTFHYLELGMWSTNITRHTFLGDVYVFTKNESTMKDSIKTNLVTLFSFWGYDELKIALREAGIAVSQIGMHIDGTPVVPNDGLLGVTDDRKEEQHSPKQAALISIAVFATGFSAIAFVFFRTKRNTSRIDELFLERSTAGETVVVRIGNAVSVCEGHHASMSLEDNGSLAASYESIPVYRFDESANETDSRLLDVVIRSPLSCRYDPRRLDRVISKARRTTDQES
jgi:hypothetical protein